MADKTLTEEARAQAVANFLKQGDLEAKLAEALKFIASRSPTAILVFWEEDEQYGAITVPYSNALSYGLANKAYETLVVAADNAAAEALLGDNDE